MTILLFGPRGYIGMHFRKRFPDAICSNVDIADPAAVAEELEYVRPDVVLNCVGKAGTPNVDWCEDHKEETFHSNVTGPIVLMEECRQRRIYWVHIGSGCIFSGDNGGRGFREEDAPNFQGSFYARTKQWADALLDAFTDSAEGSGGILILRIRMPMEPEEHSKNLLTKVTKFTKVIDVPNSVTYLPDFVDSAATLIDRRRTGIYHMVNPGPVSLYAVACMFAARDGRAKPERLTEEAARGMTKAARSNCVLSTEKLQAEGIVLPRAIERIEETLSVPRMALTAA